MGIIYSIDYILCIGENILAWKIFKLLRKGKKLKQENLTKVINRNPQASSHYVENKRLIDLEVINNIKMVMFLY